FDVAQGRVVSNPPITEKRSPSSLPRVLVERKVVINLTDVADFIGLNIRGGSEYGIGVYISRVDPGGQAARVGLSPGDQVVRVNDTDFKSVTHTDAVDILRSSTHLIITIRSVGKYPVYKELCAEYTWSDGTYYNTNNISGFKAVHVPGPKNEGKRHIHRARTRESSIDQTPYGFSQTGEVQPFDDTDLDNIQAIEDLDQALEDESKLIYPEESDIKFRRHYEDSWQDIESIKENFTREEEDMTSSWINNNSSSNHRRQDSDLSDQLDYTTFLEQSALRAKLEGRKSASQEVSSVEIHHEPVIETFVEESVTDFSMSPRSPEHRVAVLPSEALTSFGSPKTSKPSSPQHSHYAEMDSFSRERVTTTEGIYSQVNDLTGRPPIEVYHQTNSIDSSSASSSPVYASVHKMAKLNKNNGGRDEISEEIFKSQLERLQERQSNLSTWEISKVAGESPPSSDNVSVISANGSDKNKFGTWNSLKKKIGSIRIKGSAHKKRSQISRNEGESPMGSMRQKGIFERSFGSQILNTPTSERYNLMGIFEDRARLLLPEDEYKAVIRHYHTYQSDKDLERFVRLLLTILDRPEKRTLLADVRNVVSPGHLNQFDTLLETNRVQLVARQSESSQNINGEKSGNKPPKPARSKPANQMNGKTGTYDLTELSRTSPSSRTSSFTTDDFRNKQLNVVLSEDTSRPRGNPVIKEDEEVVYISKHKMILGLELTGGRNHPDDKAIKVQNVRSNGAAADDQRLQPGVEITSIDGTSVDGMTSQEAELLLQKAFSHKNPTNLGIHIRHKHLI
ncbi:whirlin, partial [Biomphalaria pfeifferi]